MIRHYSRVVQKALALGCRVVTRTGNEMRVHWKVPSGKVYSKRISGLSGLTGTVWFADEAEVGTR